MLNSNNCDSSSVIGKGSYGKVYKCQYIDSPNIRDICINDNIKETPCNNSKKSKKIVTKLFHKSSSRKTKEDYWKEELLSVKPLICLNNINKKYFSLPIGSCVSNSDYYIQSSNDGSDIYNYITGESFIPKNHIKHFFSNILEYITQVFKGLMSLHIYDFVHLDIKPENLLFSYENKITKIADFGFLTKIKTNTKYSIKGSPMFQLPEHILNSSGPYFLRKELYQFEKKSYKLYNWCKSDIYAMSVVIKELLESKNKKYITENDKDILANIFIITNTTNVERIPNSIQVLLLISKLTQDEALNNWISGTFKNRFNKSYKKKRRTKSYKRKTRYNKHL